MSYWVLVLVLVFDTSHKSVVISVNNTMEQCFDDRDDLRKVFSGDMKGWQATCIRK